VRRFLALGDSYTIGEGVADHERWPDQLVALLRSRGVEIGDPHIVARTAWTTDELSDAIDAEGLTGTFDLVTLLIGVNDQYRSRPVDSFKPEYRTLLRRATKFAAKKSKRVIAVSIPDWSATPYAEGRDRDLISREVLTYNSAAEELARAERVSWVDVTECSRAMLHDSSLVAVDGLHPTGAMYGKWAAVLLPAALTALGLE
jgi:lysophospholipase L1-like esterase